MNDTLETSSLKKFPDVIYEEATIANKNLLHYGSHSWSTKNDQDVKVILNMLLTSDSLNPPWIRTSWKEKIPQRILITASLLLNILLLFYITADTTKHSFWATDVLLLILIRLLMLRFYRAFSLPALLPSFPYWLF